MKVSGRECRNAEFYSIILELKIFYLFFAEMATAKPVYLLPCFSVFLLLLKLSVLINNLLNNIYAKLLVMEEVAKIKKLVSFSW